MVDPNGSAEEDIKTNASLPSSFHSTRSTHHRSDNTRRDVWKNQDLTSPEELFLQMKTLTLLKIIYPVCVKVFAKFDAIDFVAMQTRVCLDVVAHKCMVRLQ